LVLDLWQLVWPDERQQQCHQASVVAKILNGAQVVLGKQVHERVHQLQPWYQQQLGLVPKV